MNKLEKAEGIEQIHQGEMEFVKLVSSMSDKLESPDKTIIFISGIVGYSCQAALFE